MCNDVDRGAQARLIASHGEDATRLLHGRVEGGVALSTNLGSRALLACARLLGGEVSLRLAPDQTRLRLEVAAPRPATAALSESLVVWFLDDDPTTRRVYRSAWLKPPLDPASRVLPELGLSPEATDAAMRGFVASVLAASPRPRALLLDQNLQSQVLFTENVTTGTEITEELRRAGYDGTIAIRTANLSRSVKQEYMAAGADAVISKNQGLEALLDVLRAATAPQGGAAAAEDAPDDAPLLDLSDLIWSEVDLAERVEMVAAFRDEAHAIVARVRATITTGDVASLPILLHALAGKSRDMGAPRLRAYASSHKESFMPAHLDFLVSLLEETLVAMERADSGHNLVPARRPRVDGERQGGGVEQPGLVDAPRSRPFAAWSVVHH